MTLCVGNGNTKSLPCSRTVRGRELQVYENAKSLGGHRRHASDSKPCSAGGSRRAPYQIKTKWAADTSGAQQPKSTAKVRREPHAHIGRFFALMCAVTVSFYLL